MIGRVLCAGTVWQMSVRQISTQMLHGGLIYSNLGDVAPSGAWGIRIQPTFALVRVVRSD